jgi:hypothetical protein
VPVANAAPSAPPATAKRASAQAVKTAVKTGERTDALLGIGQLAQAGLIGARQYADAGAVGRHWPNISEEVARLAAADETIARIIDPLLRVGPYTALIAAVLPLVAQIGVNHGRIPAGTMGTVSGEMLSSQIQTSLMHAELEARKAQADAERELREMHAQMNRENVPETADVF